MLVSGSRSDENVNSVSESGDDPGPSQVRDAGNSESGRSHGLTQAASGGAWITSRVWRASTLLFGVGIIAFLLHRFGTSRAWIALGLVGWRFALILALEALVRLLDARAWWHLFPTPSRRGRFARIWLVYLAGSALNDITPGAPVGGDPVKALALKDQFTMSVTAATLLSAKLAQALARVLFVIAGLLAVASVMHLKHLPVEDLSIGFLLTAAGVVVFMALQVRGISRPAIKLLRHLRFRDDLVARIDTVLEHVDDHLSELYGTRALDFIASVALAFGGVCIDVLQIWLITGWIGQPCDWLTSLAIASFSVLLGLVFFVVPGSLGVQEGGKVLVFAALGLPLSAGFSLGIVLRLSSMANLVTGFTALAFVRRAGSAKVQVPQEI